MCDGLRVRFDRKMGLVRNLTAGEIFGQVRVLATHSRCADAVNIVDGHGRPPHNYDETAERLQPGEPHYGNATTASCPRSRNWRASR